MLMNIYGIIISYPTQIDKIFFISYRNLRRKYSYPPQISKFWKAIDADVSWVNKSISLEKRN